jgi:transposase
MAERIERLDRAIGEAIEKAPAEMRAVVEALQALRGVAVTIVAELGSLSRFAKPRQLMGYSGLVSSEFSTGNRSSVAGSRKREMRTCGV